MKKQPVLFKIVLLCIITITLSNNIYAFRNEPVYKDTLNDTIVLGKKKDSNKSCYSITDDTLYVAIKNTIYRYKNNIIETLVCLENFENDEIIKILSSKKSVVIYTKNDKLIVIDVENKNVRWEKFLNNKIVYRLILTNNRIFIDRSGHTLVALNIKNGRIKWQYFTEPGNLNVNTSMRILHSNKFLYCVSPRGKILKLRKTDGAKLNKFKFFEKHNASSTQDNPHHRAFWTDGILGR